MAPELQALLERIRGGGAVQPDDANLIEHHLFRDSMIPAMRNKAAYNDFLRDHGNAGSHVNLDLNDFGAINKYHGQEMGDKAITDAGNLIANAAQKYAGRTFRVGGDEFRAHFLQPEHAQAFAADVKAAMDNYSKNLIGGTHRLAASIGVGHNPEHAEKALMQAKWTLGTEDAETGKRKNFHAQGQAPSVIGNLLHEPKPAGWMPAEARIQQIKGTPVPTPEAPKMSAKPPTSSMSVAGHPTVTASYNYDTPPPKSNTTTVNYSNPLHKSEQLGQVMGVIGLTDPKFSHKLQGIDDLKDEAARKGFKFGTALSHDGKPMGVIHGLDMKGLRDLGKQFGQHIILATDGKQHAHIYVNGPRADHMHLGTGYDTSSPEHVFHVGDKAHGLAFDFSRLHPLK